MPKLIRSGRGEYVGRHKGLKGQHASVQVYTTHVMAQFDDCFLSSVTFRKSRYSCDPSTSLGYYWHRFDKKDFRYYQMTCHRPLLAYRVVEDCESTGGIVFAKTNAQARRLGASDFNAGEFDGLICNRAPEFDKYCPGPVPREALFENGWYYECEECSGHAYKDNGGVLTESGALCEEHADPYAWRNVAGNSFSPAWYGGQSFGWKQTRYLTRGRVWDMESGKYIDERSK